MQVAISLFPGISLLDMAFEHEGFAVVRGPDEDDYDWSDEGCQ